MAVVWLGLAAAVEEVTPLPVQAPPARAEERRVVREDAVVAVRTRRLSVTSSLAEVVEREPILAATEEGARVTWPVLTEREETARVPARVSVPRPALKREIGPSAPS